MEEQFLSTDKWETNVNSAKICLFISKENSGQSVQGCWQILSMKVLDLKYSLVDLRIRWWHRAKESYGCDRDFILQNTALPSKEWGADKKHSNNSAFLFPSLYEKAVINNFPPYFTYHRSKYHHLSFIICNSFVTE